MADCDEGCSPWGLSSWVSPRMRRLLHLTRKEIWRYVCLRRNASVFGRVRFERGEACVKPDVDSVDVVPQVAEEKELSIRMGSDDVILIGSDSRVRLRFAPPEQY